MSQELLDRVFTQTFDGSGANHSLTFKEIYRSFCQISIRLDVPRRMTCTSLLSVEGNLAK